MTARSLGGMLACVVAALFGCGGGGLHLADPELELWCGNGLCAWDVEQGSVRRVGTWHPDDHGAQLVGDPVVISQRAHIDWDVPCLLATALIYADTGAVVYLEIDIDDDGSVDRRVSVSNSSWEPVTTSLSVPFAAPPEGCWSCVRPLRVRLRKTGSGTAILARADLSLCPGRSPRPSPTPSSSTYAGSLVE